MKHYKTRNNRYQGLIIVFVATVAVVLIGTYLYFLGVPKEVTLAIVTGMFSVSAALLPKILESKRAGTFGESQTGRLQTYRNPFAVSAAAYFALLSVTFCFLLYNGAMFFVIYGHFEPPGDDEKLQMGAELGTFTALALLPFTILIAKSAAHRIRANPMLWVPGTVLLARFTLFLPVAWFAPNLLDRNTVAITSGGALFHALAAVGGVYWANKTKSEYLVRQTFRSLSAANKKALTELILANPRRWKTTKRSHDR